MVLAKVSPTMTGSMKVGSGTESSDDAKESSDDGSRVGWPRLP